MSRADRRSGKTRSSGTFGILFPFEVREQRSRVFAGILSPIANAIPEIIQLTCLSYLNGANSQPPRGGTGNLGINPRANEKKKGINKELVYLKDCSLAISVPR